MTHHTDAELLPCPFCCAGITSIRENGKMWTGQRYSEPTSVSVMHHCEPVDGQPSRAIERVGRDMESAVAAWNRRAPAAPVPHGWKLVPVEPTDEILAATSWPGCAKTDYAHMLAAAPQPPEAGCSVSNGETQAAPVQLPDPAGVVVTTIGNYASVNAAHFVRKSDKFYTEQQVRDLLAGHGIGKDKA